MMPQKLRDALNAVAILAGYRTVQEVLEDEHPTPLPPRRVAAAIRPHGERNPPWWTY